MQILKIALFIQVDFFMRLMMSFRASMMILSTKIVFII
jgi:hypothetical protein